MKNKQIIQLVNITKDFKTKFVVTNVLKEISLTIHQGEFILIRGASGSGKTTLLTLLGLMDTPTTGQYIFDGEDISEQKQLYANMRSKYFGFVFQSFYLVNELNILENVAMPMGYAGMKKKERVDRAKMLLSQVGLDSHINKYPNQLSGGEKQRVAIARALANNPLILYADEPTGNLDSSNSTKILKLLKTLNEKGLTIVMVTHDDSLIKYATRILTLVDGQITEDKNVR